MDQELDTNTKMIKIFLYGGISYIILHATLFIGGKDALLYNLKNYFWLFLLLDIVIIFMVNNKNINFEIVNNYINNTLLKRPKSSIKKNSTKKNIVKNHQLKEKKVTFAEENEYSSDSESDIGTDVDFDEFKQSLML
tara:strand:+ start:519 stop:929 length:411 start_codon:yes stop_codon:yes gene_type:complete